MRRRVIVFASALAFAVIALCQGHIGGGTVTHWMMWTDPNGADQRIEAGNEGELVWVTLDLESGERVTVWMNAIQAHAAAKFINLAADSAEIQVPEFQDDVILPPPPRNPKP